MEKIAVEAVDSGYVIDSMTDIVACLNTSDSIQRFLLDIHCILQKVTYADNFYVVLYQENGNLSFPYFHDVKDDIQAEELDNLSLDDISHSLTAFALKSHKVCNFKQKDIEQLIESNEVSILGSVPKQWLCFPLVNRNQHLGAFIIQSYRKENEYSGMIVDVLYTISHVISSALDAFNNQQALIEANRALQNYQSELEVKVQERTSELKESLNKLEHEIEVRESLQQQLEHDSLHDSLTGLANRKYLFKELERLSARSQRNDTLVYILYLDLDDFKPVNDNHGHQSGDIVLKTVSERLIQTLRSYDFICRLGGDEFVVMLTEQIERQSLTLLAERMLQSLSAPIKLDSGIEVQCGCSIGIASVINQSFDAQALIHNADLALYEAKGRGKNQIYFAK
ncbi:sensor domain-containing diguanylate cyclase [Pseudoalteromonas obscura]|uniref:Diguanylate cyclase n=1 Tax=Pseudoalteromonas obscura TaxID=3048491 RepID=A0ABT7EGN9_9GAMM|nr:sensor domain-containing diguanylate cyclase [Pseudoalteromonas sp. P94(2023)]MDK2594210.1 diguanylate cyclase [Pseudoalteromonas sp. P94(2023)]